MAEMARQTQFSVRVSPHHTLPIYMTGAPVRFVRPNHLGLWFQSSPCVKHGLSSNPLALTTSDCRCLKPHPQDLAESPLSQFLEGQLAQKSQLSGRAAIRIRVVRSATKEMMTLSVQPKR